MATPTFTLPTSGSDPKVATKEGLEENINQIIQYLDDMRISGDAALMTGLEFQGGWDASTGLFPDQDRDGGPITKGDFFWVSTEGTFGSVTYSVNEPLVAAIDNPSTTDASDWYHAPVNPALVPVVSRLDDMAVQFGTVANFFSTTLEEIKTAANRTTGTVYVHVTEGGHNYTVDLSQSTAATLTTTAGVGVTVLRGAGGLYDWMAWGVKVQDASTTFRAQEAIDFCLESDEAELLAPAGHYLFSQLRLSNSAGGARADRSKMTLRGTGSLALTEAYQGERNSDYYGTIIESTETTLDGVVMASDEDTNNRRAEMENLTVIYSGSGYAIDATYCPFFELKDVTVRIESAGGKAINAESMWGARFERFIAAVDSDITSTATGIRLTSALFAGNVEFNNCIIDAFYDCVHMDVGSNFVNIIFENTWLQKFHRYGLYCTSPVWNLVLRDHYTESGTGVSAIKLAAANAAGDPKTITNFDIDGLFVLGGTVNTQWLSGPAIDMERVDTFAFKRVLYYRPYTAFCSMGDDVLSGTVDEIAVRHDGTANLPTGPLYLFDGLDGKDGNVSISNRFKTDTSKLEWFDDSISKVARYDGKVAEFNAISFGTIGTETLAVSTYNLSNADPRPMVLLVTTTGGASSAVRLPAGTSVSGSDTRIIVNDPSSTQGVILRNSGNTSIGYTIPVGGAAMCIYVPSTDKWLVLPYTVGAYGP